MVTKEQADAYQILANILGKLILVVLVSLAFAAMTILFLCRPSWHTATPNSLLALVILQVVRHYFPIAQADKLIRGKKADIDPPKLED